MVVSPLLPPGCSHGVNERLSNMYHSLSTSSFLEKFLVPASLRWTAVFQFARRLRGILLQPQETHRIMAGQNHQRTTLYNIMILSCHDSVSLGCGWPRWEISPLLGHRTLMP